MPQKWCLCGQKPGMKRTLIHRPIKRVSCATVQLWQEMAYPTAGTIAPKLLLIDVRRTNGERNNHLAGENRAHNGSSPSSGPGSCRAGSGGLGAWIISAFLTPCILRNELDTVSKTRPIQINHANGTLNGELLELVAMGLVQKLFGQG